MIIAKLLTAPEEINAVVPSCIELARKEEAVLPFQFLHMPLTWWEIFRPEQQDELFWKKRGKNFLGIQSRLEQFFLLVAEEQKEICGFVPLVKYALKIPAGQDELCIITMAGDYVLHPFQDFVVDHSRRKEAICIMLNKASELLGKGNSVFWIGYIPEESVNLDAIRYCCNDLRKNNVESLETISSQRGGVWPWTIRGISSVLEKINVRCRKAGIDIDGLSALITQLEKCTPQTLLFPRTRTNILQDINKLLPLLQNHEVLAELVEKLDSLLKNSPMLYPYIELPQEREDYLMSLSYSTRRYFRRYMKKFFEAGAGFETLMPHEITDRDIEDYISLHLLRWGDSSAAICGEAADYHRKISRSMAKLGLFKLFFATYKGKRIAVHSCFDIGPRREGYITGLDPEYHDLRAGRLLYLHTIYDAIDRGMKRYELGAVGFDYKMSFVKETAVAYNFFLYQHGQDSWLDQIFTGFECMEPVIREY